MAGKREVLDLDEANDNFFPGNKPWLGVVFTPLHDNVLTETHDLGQGLKLRPLPHDLLKSIRRSAKAWTKMRTRNNVPHQELPFCLDNPHQTTGDHTQLSSEDFRYAAIENSECTISFCEMNYIFSVCSSDLRMGHIVVPQMRGELGNQPYLTFPKLAVRDILGRLNENIKPFRLEELNTLKDDIKYLAPSFVDKTFPEEIRKIGDVFQTLDRLEDENSLKVLGYFAVLEGLLTHNPEKNDSVDSIQRQLTRNINCMNNRLKDIGRDVDFSNFGETKLKKIIASLYSYRSAIAHGGDESQSRRTLENIAHTKSDYFWIHDFVRNLTKRMLFSALREPQLVMDLK